MTALILIVAASYLGAYILYQHDKERHEHHR